MKAIAEIVASIDDRPDRECYRCDRDVPGDQLCRLSFTVSDSLADRYESVSRPCCIDCAAALGMLELTDWIDENR